MKIEASGERYRFIPTDPFVYVPGWCYRGERREFPERVCLYSGAMVSLKRRLAGVPAALYKL